MQYRSNGEEKNAKKSNDGNIIPLFVCSKLTKGRKLNDKGVKPSLTLLLGISGILKTFRFGFK